MDLYKICRTCLSEIRNSKSLFNLQYINDEHLKLSEILTACTSIEVLENDNLPKQVCIQCENNILNTFKFQEQCHKSNSLLRAILSNSAQSECTLIKRLDNTEEISLKSYIQQSILLSNNTFEQEKVNNLVNGAENSNSSSGKVIKIELDSVEISNDDGDDLVNSGKDVENVYVSFGHINSTTFSFKEENDGSNISSSYTDSDHSQHKPSGTSSNYTFKHDQVNDLDETIDAQLTSVKILKEDSDEDERNFGDKGHIESISYIFNEDYEDGLSPNYHAGDQQINPNDIPEEVEDETLQPLFPCEAEGCTACFTEPEDLEEHSKKHLQDYCKMCEKNFASGTVPQRLTSKHQLEKKTHLCNYCGKEYTSGEKPYLCSYCGRRYANLRRLERHTRIHTGERPHQCNLCSKKFISSSDLEGHIFEVHQNEAPYSCNTCGKLFADLCRLYAHIHIHSGEKPGENLSNLKSHMRSHTREKPYPCNVCTETLITSENLERHTIGVHRREKSFTCNVCNKSFAHYSNYEAHKKSHKQS